MAADEEGVATPSTGVNFCVPKNVAHVCQASTCLCSLAVERVNFARRMRGANFGTTSRFMRHFPHPKPSFKLLHLRSQL